MNKKKFLKTGCIAYETIVCSRVFGHWKIYDKKFAKQYKGLTDREIDLIFFGKITLEELRKKKNESN